MKTDYLIKPTGERIAYSFQKGTSETTIFFLSGFRSHKSGGKAESLMRWCQKSSQHSFICFDYRGHGLSEGHFEALTFEDWLDDARFIFRHFATDKNIIIASSMGAWLGFHLTEQLPYKVHGIITIAAATDLTQFIEKRISEKQRRALSEQGFFNVISPYTGESYPFSQKLIESGLRLHMLDRKIQIDCPIFFNHSLKDREIPWINSVRSAECITGKEVEIILTKKGDHQLSSQEDIERYYQQIQKIEANF